MQKEVNIKLSPASYGKEGILIKRIASSIGIDAKRIFGTQLIRRSIDARRGKVSYVLRLKVWIDERPEGQQEIQPTFQNVKNSPEAVIIGCGPAGLFAALRLISQGIKPIIFERGKAVRPRRRDLANITKEGIVDPDSNYCFGEGGAGTFSDGKLYTRSTKRGDTRSVLETLVHFGATREILIDAHPHIGTNKLPQIIQNMREKIIECGGEVHFEERLTDINIDTGGIREVHFASGRSLATRLVILATGHSARDIFELVAQKGWLIHPKPFALGLRVEHPQGLIDSVQYHTKGERHPNLPAAAYTWTRQVDGKGVHSFCMCPGGIICPSATKSDEVVVNGWSPSKRNSPFANSGIVVQLEPKDFLNKENDPLSGIHFQKHIEQKAFEMGGGKQQAPGQRLMDFLENRTSSTLPTCSYLPGTTSSSLKELLPRFIAHRLRHAFRGQGKNMKGYLTNEALVLGVESRTSSPVQIPRNKESFMHPQVSGLFPCGEGAGYAGGIMSAAIDGQKCADAAFRFIQKL